MQIEDGTGHGNKVRVDDENRIRTYSVVEEEITHSSEDEGEAYVWVASKNIDATDSIIWLRNDSTTKELMIHCISVSTDAAGSFFIYCPTGTTADGDTVAGVNMNRGSGNVALATCRSDATGTTPANYIYYGHCRADETICIEFHGALILGYLDEVAVDITDEPGLAQANIVGFYHT
jgi:hypothetical protein